MQTAIIHTASRVIRRLTVEGNPTILSDETGVSLVVDIDLNPTGSPTGYWKLDLSNNKVAASLAEVTAAGVDDGIVNANRIAKLQTYKNALSNSSALDMDMSISVGGNVTLTNVGSTYDAIAASKGLGVFLLDFSEVSIIRVDLFVSKVGTGTQSWQLWNHTDGVELGVINDAGATGDKVLSGTINSGLPTTGIKLCRIRCKSTTAADDPIFYGGAVGVRRPSLRNFFSALLDYINTT